MREKLIPVSSLLADLNKHFFRSQRELHNIFGNNFHVSIACTDLNNTAEFA